MTKKEKQRKENNEVLQYYNKYLKDINYYEQSKLFNCQAWYGMKQSVILNGKLVYDVIPLKSYSTVVAYIVKDYANNDTICIDVLRYVYGYTATSAKHIAKFFNLLSRDSYKILRYKDI